MLNTVGSNLQSLRNQPPGKRVVKEKDLLGGTMRGVTTFVCAYACLWISALSASVTPAAAQSRPAQQAPAPQRPVYQPPVQQRIYQPPVQQRYQAPQQQQVPQQDDPNACYDANHRVIACRSNQPAAKGAKGSPQIRQQQQAKGVPQGQVKSGQGQVQGRVAVARPGVIRGAAGALRKALPPGVFHDPGHRVGSAGKRYNRQAFMFKSSGHIYRRAYYLANGGTFFYDEAIEESDPSYAAVDADSLPDCAANSDDCQGGETEVASVEMAPAASRAQQAVCVAKWNKEFQAGRAESTDEYAPYMRDCLGQAAAPKQRVAVVTNPAVARAAALQSVQTLLRSKSSDCVFGEDGGTHDDFQGVLVPYESMRAQLHTSIWGNQTIWIYGEWDPPDDKMCSLFTGSYQTERPKFDAVFDSLRTLGIRIVAQ